MEEMEQQPTGEITVGEERIGDYRVHPAAAMFPMLEGQNYEDLRSSIEAYGQQKPVVAQGDLLLDGRNRLKVCLELEIEPRVEQYTGKLDPVDYILVANVDRRHLGPDERSAICTKIRAWRIEQRNTARKVEQGHHGAEGGRGKKKTLTQDSEYGISVSKPDRNTRTTVGQIAEQAGVSRHKAAQAVAVGKAAPDLLDQVAKGEMKLKDAYAQVRAAADEPRKRTRAGSDQRKIGGMNLYAKAEKVHRFPSGRCAEREHPGAVHRGRCG